MKKTTDMNRGQDDSLVTVGRVVREWGLRGEVLVFPLTFDPERFFDLDEIALVSPATRSGSARTGEAPMWKRITSVARHQDSILLGLREVSTPEQAKGYRGALVQIRRSESPPLPSGVYYHYQIIGLEVFTIEGRRLGTVEEIIETGSNDVYTVKGDEGEYLLPAVKEVIKDIDIMSGKIIVKLMEAVE